MPEVKVNKDIKNRIKVCRVKIFGAKLSTIGKIDARDLLNLPQGRASGLHRGASLRVDGVVNPRLDNALLHF